MRWHLGWMIVLLAAATAQAELTADEVGVIAMAQSDPSHRLAEYYAKARGIPESHVLFLPGKPGGTMARSAWEEQVRPAIRAWLDGNGRKAKIRCLVTCWDVPLRIGRRSPNAPEVAARQEYLSRARADAVRDLERVLAKLDSVGREGSSPELPAPDPQAEISTLTAQFDAALQAARERLQGVESEEKKKQAAATFEHAFVAGVGIKGLLGWVARRGGRPDLQSEVGQRLNRLNGRLEGLAEGLQALSRLPDSVPRDVQIINLIRPANGLLGTIAWIDQQEEVLRRNETHASFDSELSQLHWPDYSLSRWQPNTLHYRFDSLTLRELETLMVSRLEAPTFELAKNLIDTAIATEKTGLTGKVYLDARGMRFNPKTDKPGSYGAYDQSLRDLADRLKKHSKLQVVLNNEAKLFGQGDCPDAALYCGWYSLAKYIDAFDWQPGAVGYHMASSEATTLRTPGGKVWCNAMLEDGICATMGPVNEPYLASFPLPDDFFPMLLTGRYTLAEAYYRTKPFNSWVMVLVGDPLYNPFKNKPALDEDALPQRITGADANGPQ